MKKYAKEKRKERNDELREYISKVCTVKHVIKKIEKLEDLAGEEMTSLEFQRLGKAIDTRLKLVNKYLGDDKQLDIDMNATVTHENATPEELAEKKNIIEERLRASGINPDDLRLTH